MAEPTNEETKPRPTGIVAWGEVLQLLSVLSIGLMLIVPITTCRHHGEPVSYGGWWFVLAAIAVAGLVCPFILPDASAGEYSWDDNRINTLKLVLPDKTSDIVSALTAASERRGDAEKLRTTLSNIVGEERAAQFLPTLYRYLRVRDKVIIKRDRGETPTTPPGGVGDDKLPVKRPDLPDLELH